MKLAFTGTQRGMSQRQFNAFLMFMLDSRWTEFGNGLCVGADAEAILHVAMTRTDVKITGFPPDRKDKIAWQCTALCHTLRAPKPPLKRDDDLAAWCDEMVATPYQDEEIIRSGTWTTIRRARKYQKPVTILEP